MANSKTKGIGEYFINLLLAIFILGIIYNLRFLIEFIYAIFGRKIDLSLKV